MGGYFDVYGRYEVAPVRGRGYEVFTADGQRYLDLYGGHGVISLGHAHPAWVKALQQQVEQLAFYSNAVQLPEQEAYAEQLAQASAYPQHRLFMVNSGAEANENALKLASLHTGRTRFLAFRGGWHGRTAAALGVTDDPKLYAPVNQGLIQCDWVDLNEEAQVEAALASEAYAAVIVEGIQGVGGLAAPSAEFLVFLRKLTRKHGTLLILDEIQSGFGRTGAFFAHQRSGEVQADLVTMAKGMGNGFPVGGLLISPEIEAVRGSLGTTFGGNPLALAAGQAVLNGIRAADLTENARTVGAYAQEQLAGLPGVLEVRGAGLMLGLRFEFPVAQLRKDLLYKHFIFTGGSNDANLLRILPPLSLPKAGIDELITALSAQLKLQKSPTT